MKAYFPLFFASVFVLGCQEPEVVQNAAPLADAGDAITLPADQRVTLDGRASYDKNGDALIYHWTFDHMPADSALSDMVEPFSVNHIEEGSTTFQPDAVGTYIVKLEVFDGHLYSNASYVVVNATAPEDAPIAEAGATVVAELGTAITLDGSQSSDPLGGVLLYQWALVEVPVNSSLSQTDLIDADQMSPSFTGDVIGSYTATLVVDNGLSLSAPDSVRVELTGDNVSPTADAGGDLNDMDCKDVVLDCSGSSDPEGDTLSYWWILQSVPDGSAVDNRSISNQQVADPTFWADIAGLYTISCSVFDGATWSHPDTITLDIAERDYNTPPSVDAGPDLDVDAGEADCESSTSTWYPYNTTWSCESCDEQSASIGVSTGDADGDPYVLEWIIDEDTNGATLVGADRVPATVVLDPANPTRDGQCKDRDFDFILAATDCTGARAEDEVSITVECCGVGS